VVLLRLNARHSLSLGVAVALALAPSIAVSIPAASAGQNGSTQHLTLKGFFTPGNVTTSGEIAPSIDQVPGHSPHNKAIEHVPAAGVAKIAGNNISGTANTVVAWNGISHFDQRTAGTGDYVNTQFSLEPPDQGLCVGNGNVVEAVNNAYRVYDTAGHPKTPVIALSQFFGLPPEVHRPAGPFGPFISDPKCYYDPDTNTFFLTELELEVNPTYPGAFAGPSDQLIAVSSPGDPITLPWAIYSFSTTDSRPGCPCFGDQPLIGADANGFYIATNEYGVFSSAYYGAQLYAISKTALATHAVSPAVTHIDAGTKTLAQGGLAYSVQPATSPHSGYATANGGTEYFLSTTDWSTGPAIGVRANTVEVWALTNTSSLGSDSPSLALSNIALPSEPYSQPPNAQQESGATPLGTSVHDALELLDTNDDRMNQVVFANGLLWAGANSAVKPPNGPVVAGIAYFVVNPNDGAGTLTASMAEQGFIGASNEYVMYPSIGVTPDGGAVVAFSLSGPDHYPSAAYAHLNLTTGAGDIHIAGAGVAPDDGFTGYDEETPSNGSARWGDYSAAVSDLNGNIWMAAEYIPGGPRTLLANWGTYVSEVAP
jgi:hypothetical protein